jgi:hypothetical protein
MSELTAHGQNISNCFELLGHDENALTFAVGWTLCESPYLLRLLLHENV